MPRPTNNSLLALFKYNDLNQIVCYNEKCDGKALYKHSANLERHLKKLHPFIYSSYIQKKKILKFPRKLNFEKRLIDLVRVYPILWNKFEDNRFNEDLTNKAWREISYKMEVTVHMCKKKWDNLIEKFRSELIQIHQPIPGTDTLKDSTSNWKSRWKYFSELQFLRDQLDLTRPIEYIQPSEQMENMKINYIKEESSESYQLYNETLEDSSQIDYGDESITQDDRDESRLIDEIRELRPQDEREVSGQPDDSGVSKLRNDTEFSMKQSKRRPSLEETDSEDDYTDEQPKKVKRKQVIMSESANSEMNDADRMFLLSLLPFLRSIPDRKKLFVRHRIQGVLLEEQNNS